MMVREEEPDGGQVTVDRGTSIGYFSQDVGEMRGQTVIAATLAGAGAVSEVAERLRAIEHSLGDFSAREFAGSAASGIRRGAGAVRGTGGRRRPTRKPGKSWRALVSYPTLSNPTSGRCLGVGRCGWRWREFC